MFSIKQFNARLHNVDIVTKGSNLKFFKLIRLQDFEFSGI